MTGTTKILTILVCAALIIGCQIINWNLTDHILKALTNGMAMGLAGFCAWTIIRTR